ncbi:Large exoproteins involved in heme utilization or adhesion [Burkholderia singularis]|uniref:Large exoproteins involved in heme utilization or adhesion n=2 Tax=Burkholderia singularis TaxID=1503053 RepID=A0A238GY85_9BURK|nr:Large exoproteins involved in heme utilization or adhesion [Burkholderia singularis]
MSGAKIASGIDQTATYSQGSTISADGVNIVSGKDINVTGSNIVGTNDVALTAARNVTITTSQDTLQSSSYYDKKESGLMSGGGLSVTVGSRSQSDKQQTSTVTNTGSTIGSLKGNLTVTAGNDLHVTGSDLIAGQNVTGIAKNVTIDAAAGSSSHHESHETKQSGLTVGLAGTLPQAVQGAVGQAQSAGGSQDSRAKALHAIAAAGQTANVAQQLSAGGTPDIGIQVSVGSSHSKSTFTESQTTQTGSNVVAGGTAAFVATGDKNQGQGNITIAGSDVTANNVLLNAANQVNLVNTTSTDSTRSTNESSSASVGVQVTTRGVGVSASMAKAHGDGNSDAVMQNNTHITGTNNVSIVSGGDTNIIGAVVSGKHVSADVGGSLNLASVQDTTVSEAHQKGSGGGFTISQGGGSANFSNQHGDASGHYAGVAEQAGIKAGDGGFDVNVKGNTDLKGAVIASTADPSKNHLTTGTLTYSDIQNHSDYSASSSGFSAGASMGVPTQATGPGSVPNAGGVTPMLSQHDSGSESATTKSGVSAGTVTITDTPNQQQALANLNRDTSNTNGTVSKTPDLQNLLGNQADMMNAASAAGEAMATQIGRYADDKRNAANKAAEQAVKDGNPELAAQYRQEAASWDEGGTNRVALHTAGGAMIASLGGGSALAGAAGAGLSAALAGKLNSVADSIAGATGDTNAGLTAGNILSNVLATSAGALVGGNSGAFAAANVDLYNRDQSNGQGKGGTGSQFIDSIGEQFASAARGALNLAEIINHALNKIIPSPSGQKPDADANPLIDVTGGQRPPPTAGAVVTPMPCPVGPGACGMAVTPVVTPGAPILANGSGGNSSTQSRDGNAPDNGSGSDVNLASPDRTNHILNGDATGGGHLWPGAPGKSAFPENWSASKVMNAVSDIATDPAISEAVQANGRIVKNGTVDGIDIRVVIEPSSKGGGIVTAFPTNIPRNP